MNILQYVRSLIPALEKRYILNDVGAVRENLVDVTLPTYTAAMEKFGTAKLAGKVAAEFDRSFQQAVTGHRIRGNYINVTHAALVQAVDQVAIVDEAIRKHFAKDVIASGITYRQANILRYCELLRFVSKYARGQLIQTIAGETNVKAHNTAGMGKEVSAPEAAWLRRNQTNYFGALNIIFESGKDLARTLENVPDIIVDPNTADVMISTVGLSKLEPQRLSRAGFVGNPIFHFRVNIVDLQTSEYEIALEEKRMLELLLLEYEQIEDGDVDVKLQKTIESTKARIEKLKYRIEKREREAREDQ